MQTGLIEPGNCGRSASTASGPDILVSGKGISGGMYPVSVVLAPEAAAGWLSEDGFGHMSTFGGAELGCVAALKTLEITCRPEVRSLVHYIAAMFTEGLTRIEAPVPGLVHRDPAGRAGDGPGVRHPQGAKFVMKRLYENGVWATLLHARPHVLQYKPGILLAPELCEELLERTEVAIGKARGDVRPGDERPGAPRGGPIPAGPRERGALGVSELLTDPAGVPRARAMLQRAEWAARTFAR